MRGCDDDARAHDVHVHDAHDHDAHVHVARGHDDHVQRVDDRCSKQGREGGAGASDRACSTDYARFSPKSARPRTAARSLGAF